MYFNFLFGYTTIFFCTVTHLSFVSGQLGHYGPVPYSYEQKEKIFLKLKTDPNHVQPTKPTPDNLFSWLNLRNQVKFYLWTSSASIILMVSLYYSHEYIPVQIVSTKNQNLNETEKNPELAQELRFNDLESVRKSNFDPARLTKIVIHGYADGASEVQIGTWIVEMRDAYLQLADVNYIAVDFSVFASFFLYFTAVPEMVGERLAEMITFMHEKHGLLFDPLHLIGWSWGAQIAGFAGNRHQGKIGRISGIDPAGPTFKFVDEEFRLDKTDAKFVDIIHVNGGKLLFWGYYGLEDSIGHVDIFPNGGKKQTGCPVERTLIYETLWCSHGRGVRYYTESITSPVAFPSCRCESFDKFVRGECLCDEKNIVYMGEHLSINSPRGNYYLITKAKEPYGHGHGMNVSLVSNIKEARNSSELNPQLSAIIRYNETNEEFLIPNTYNALSSNYPNDDILSLSLALTRSPMDGLQNYKTNKTDEHVSSLSSLSVQVQGDNEKNKNSTVTSHLPANQQNS